MNRYKQTIYFMMLLLIYLCIVPFIFAFTVSFFLNLSGSFVFSDKIAFMTFSSFVTPFICFFIPAAFYFLITKESLCETLKINKISIKNLLLIILMSFLIQPVLNLVSLITSFFFTNNVSDIMSSISETPFFIFFTVSALLPAIFEELVFRGIILSGCRSAGIIKSALISGLFFGIMHLDPHQFMYAFAAGTIFALFVLYTNSIFASVTAHAVINGTQGIMLIISEALSQNAPEEKIDALNSFSVLKELAFMGIIALVFGILFSLLFVYFIKSNKNTVVPLSEYEKPQKKIITVPFIIILIIFAVYIIFMQ